MDKGFKFILLLILGFSMFLTGCGSSSNGSENKNGDAPPNKNSSGEKIFRVDEQDKLNSNDSSIDNGGLVNMENVKVKLTFNNEEVIVNMYDNSASRDFLAQLPLTVTLEDYIGKEKISILQKKLSVDRVSSKNQPQKGDFAYFSPWGNIAIFYKGLADPTNDLIILGEIESGKENFENIQGDFTVHIEKVN
ncbi:cyclophilin-like fold protein [Bacillus litorisediminis]|uniref:cyclophilin-like fold protein n=1 Tax=Bacillus litorisediminis TaxID=2922713 RepID=UPI001FAFED71|nr:cyclophilin-like fold protein [Bacillus litorisediminis]